MRGILKKKRSSDTGVLVRSSKLSSPCALGLRAVTAASVASNDRDAVGGIPTACAALDASVVWSSLQSIRSGFLTAGTSLSQRQAGPIFVRIRERKHQNKV